MALLAGGERSSDGRERQIGERERDITDRPTVGETAKRHSVVTPPTPPQEEVERGELLVGPLLLVLLRSGV
jgi:hypothetical protein